MACRGEPQKAATLSTHTSPTTRTDRKEHIYAHVHTAGDDSGSGLLGIEVDLLAGTSFLDKGEGVRDRGLALVELSRQKDTIVIVVPPHGLKRRRDRALQEERQR